MYFYADEMTSCWEPLENFRMEAGYGKIETQRVGTCSPRPLPTSRKGIRARVVS